MSSKTGSGARSTTEAKFESVTVTVFDIAAGSGW
jgi:hypothetical protein